MRRKLLVCQNQTCRQQGSTRVLAAFQQFVPDEVQVEGTGCLGQCGNGPMAIVLPDEIWYCRIQVDDVPIIVEHHLEGGRIVSKNLYREFHPTNQSVMTWVFLFMVFLVLLILFSVRLASQPHYL